MVRQAINCLQGSDCGAGEEIKVEDLIARVLDGQENMGTRQLTTDSFHFFEEWIDRRTE
jgi:hypothetical protein